MPRELQTAWFGVFLVEEGEVREARPFPPEAQAIADRLAVLRDGGVLDEERDLAKAGGEVQVAHRRLLQLGGVQMGRPTPMRHVPEDQGVPPSLAKEAAMLLARQVIRDDLADRTLHLMQAVSALDESHDTENLLGERLVYWFTLHAPDVVDDAKDHLTLARLVVEKGDRAGILGEDAAEGLGSAIPADELAAVRGLASALVSMVEARRPLESFIDATTEALAPNLTTLVGPKIAARLIHQAGGLLDLAKMPASTLQTLGAEKALFRHLVQGAPPPKHGVIFQHPHIHRSHPNDRGPIARALAAKAVIAARADAFSGNDVAGELKAAFEARVEQVKRMGRRKAMARRGPPKGKGGRSRKGGGRRG